jgi:transposase
MKVQEVILQAMAKRMTWWQAAEILGISDRSIRRWRERYQKHGYDGLLDRRRGKPRGKRVPLETVEEVLRLLQKADILMCYQHRYVLGKTVELSTRFYPG